MKINIDKLLVSLQGTIKAGVKRIAADIADSGKVGNAKRELNIKIVFKPDIESSKVDVNIDSNEKLSKKVTEQIVMYVAKKNGEPIVSGKEIGQLYFDDLDANEDSE